MICSSLTAWASALAEELPQLGHGNAIISLSLSRRFSKYRLEFKGANAINKPLGHLTAILLRSGFGLSCVLHCQSHGGPLVYLAVNQGDDRHIDIIE